MTCAQSTLKYEFKFVFSPDIILSGWLGSKHQVTNCLCFSFSVCLSVGLPVCLPASLSVCRLSASLSLSLIEYGLINQVFTRITQSWPNWTEVKAYA